MKVTGTFLICLALSLAACTNHNNKGYYVKKGLLPLGKVSDKAPTSVGLLHLRTKKDEPLCTAFVVDANYAVTAAHCVDNKVDIGVLVRDINNNPAGSAEVVGYYSRGDYALLLGDFSSFLPILIAPSQALGRSLVGAPLTAVGFPMGQTQAVATAVSVISPMDSILLSRGELYPGMSGGPVILNLPFGPVAVGLITASSGGEFGIPDLIIISPLTGLAGAFNVEPKIN